MARPSNLALRFLTAGVLGPVLIVAMFCRRPEPWWVVIFLSTLAGLAEYGGIVLGDRPRRERWLLIALGGAFAAAAYWVPLRVADPWRWLFIAQGLLALALLGGMLASPADMRGAAIRAALMALGILYTSLMTFAAMVKGLPGGRDGAWWVFLTLTIPWFGDTAAYFAGRALGKHKLYPAVSPGKTWEGAIGGLAGSALAVLVAERFYLPALVWWDCLALAIPAGALGQAGDLAESLLKRAWGVKDSGRMLPGHGGMLDRVDALMFAAPYVYIYGALVVAPRLGG